MSTVSKSIMKTSTLVAMILGAITVLGVVGVFFTWLLFMHTEVAEPGTELVIVDKPYMPFFHEGVRPETVKEGRVLLFRTSSAIVVNTTPQSVIVPFDDLSSADNILLDFETTIQFQYTDSIRLATKFGTDAWFQHNVERQYMSIVRSAVRTKTMSQMMSDNTATARVDQQVTEDLQRLVTEEGLPIRIIGVSLGRAKPNAAVLNQMNETAAQQQREKTLIASTRAEEQREKEQVAKAKADNAYRNAMQLSPEMFIQLESIKRYSDACAKSSHCIVSSGQTNVMVPTK